MENTASLLGTLCKAGAIVVFAVYVVHPSAKYMADRVDGYANKPLVPVASGFKPKTAAELPKISAADALKRFTQGTLAPVTPAERSRASRIYGPPDNSYKKFPPPKQPEVTLGPETSSTSEAHKGFVWPWGQYVAAALQAPSSEFHWPWGQIGPQDAPALLRLPYLYVHMQDLFPTPSLPAPLPAPSQFQLNMARHLAQVANQPPQQPVGPTPAVDLGH